MRVVKIRNQSISTLFLVMQYLSNAARCFLPKPEKGGYREFCFFMSENSFVVYLSEDPRCTFAFNYERYTLEWVYHNSPKIIRLNGSNHKEIIRWIRTLGKEANYEKKYTYVSKRKEQFPIADNYVFSLSDMEEIDHIIHMRSVAHEAINKILQDLGSDESIGIRPVELSSSVKVPYPGIPNIHIELGYIVLDTYIDVPYYFLSCYKGGRRTYVSKMKPLKNGYWVEEHIKGAVLPENNISIATAVAFFREALMEFVKRFSSF